MMDDWVKVSPADLSRALKGIPTKDRGAWLNGFEHGIAGLEAHPDAKAHEQAGNAYGRDLRNAATADKERLSREKSEAGKRGNVRRWGSQSDRSATAQRSQDASQSIAEERRGEERETEQAARAGARLTSSEWTPHQEHRDLAAIRRLDVEAQIARFRNRCGQALDTDEGWRERFTQWLGVGRPERAPAPVVEPMTPPTEAEWLTEARSVAMQHPPFPDDPGFVWGKELARAKWAEHQAEGWRGLRGPIQDWRAQLLKDCTTWVGYEVANRKRPAK